MDSFTHLAAVTFVKTQNLFNFHSLENIMSSDKLTTEQIFIKNTRKMDITTAMLFFPQPQMCVYVAQQFHTTKKTVLTADLH